MEQFRSAIKQTLNQSHLGSMLVLAIQKIVTVITTIIHFVTDHKNMVNITIVVLIAIIGLCGYLTVQIVMLQYRFANDAEILYHTTSYDTQSLPGFAVQYPTIPQAVQGFQDISDTVSRYKEYVQSLQGPYTNVLQHILLPSLFIRKDPYTNQLDTQLVGRRFITENPFTDTALVQYRSDFFRNVGDGNEYILIKDMRLGDIQEGETLFTIPVNVSFIAPSKRAFLLLVDKLTLTSQESTVSLINEFFYHVRVAIKSQKKEILATVDGDIDLFIGQSLYQRAFANQETLLIDEQVIWQAVQDAALCQLVNTDICLYNFRNTYRSIPQLAYGIGLQVDKSNIQALQAFIRDLPPLITINDFTFRKVAVAGGSQPQYEGSVSIQMYGRAVSENNVSGIASELSRICLGTNTPFTPDLAIQTIDEYLRRIADTQIAQQQSTQLLQLRRIITQDQESFMRLTNYNKVIRLFEIQRMLADTGICR